MQQGDQVIGGVAERGALEVDDADAADTRAVGKPDQVAGEPVPVDEGLGPMADGLQHGGERGCHIVFRFGRRGRFEHRRPPPVEQRAERGFRHEGRIPGRQARGRGGALDRDQRVQRGAEEGILVVRGQHSRKQVVSEIFFQQEALFRLGREDTGDRQANA